jgi:phosphatidate phosphatase
MKVVTKLVECLPFLVILTLTLVLHFTITPIQRGFFCGDHTLKYPYIEHQTVPQYVCLVLWIGISGLTIITTQILQKSTSTKTIMNMISGALSCTLLTDVVKHSVGKLRPHFLTLCNPDYNNVCYDQEAY